MLSCVEFCRDFSSWILMYLYINNNIKAQSLSASQN